MTRNNIILAATTLLMFAACQKAEMPLYTYDPDAVRIEATVATQTKSNPMGTEEEQAIFNDGDRISVTNGGKSYVYKLTGSSWVPEDNDKYFKWDIRDLQYDFYFPAGYTEIPSDQSNLDKMATADKMESNIVFGEIPTDRILRASLSRINVLVTVNIKKYQDQYNPETDYISDFSFWGPDYKVQKPLVKGKDGSIIESDNESWNKGTVGYSYSAILTPNASGENSDVNFIRFNICNESGIIEELVVKGIPTLNEGYSYTFDLIVGKAFVKLGTVSVNEWTTGEKISDGDTDTPDLPEAWDGTTATAFAGGTGIKENPYLISNGAQLAYLAQQVKGGDSYRKKYFKLTSDINLGGKEWTPIGENDDNQFSGIFDGAGNTVYNLKTDSNTAYVGLFGYVRPHYSDDNPAAAIKNVRIVSANVKTSDGYAGSIVGYQKNSNIENCTASDVIVSGSKNVGGLMGGVNYVTISNCHLYSGSITCTNERAGGITGYCDSGTMKNCSVNALIEGGYYIGGLIGLAANNHSHITNCIVKANLRQIPGDTVWRNHYGGFVGWANNASLTFSNCSYEGTISGQKIESSGIAIGRFQSNTNAHTLSFTKCTCTIDAATYEKLNGVIVGDKNNEVITGITVIVTE